MCQLSPAQEEDTAIVSDTTDDLWFLTEGESEQVSVEMKEATLEEGSGGEGEACPEEEEGAGKEEKGDKEVCVGVGVCVRSNQALLVLASHCFDLPIMIVFHVDEDAGGA